MDLKHPHDAFFKDVMGNEKNLSDFLRHFLPNEVSTHLDYNTIRLIDREVIKKDYKKYHLDILAEAKIGDKPCDILILFEHKSYKDKFTVIQILSYMLATWESNITNNEPLKPIIPIVFYHGKQKYDLPTNFEGYFEVPEYLKSYIVKFRYELFDTAVYDEKSIEQKFANNLLMLAGLIAFKNILSGKEGLLKVFQWLSHLGVATDTLNFILDYITYSVDISLEEIDRIAKEGGIENMPSLAERLLEEGEQRGIKKGEQLGKSKGKLESKQEVLIKQIQLKHGITEKEKDFIRTVTDLDKLDLAIEKILTNISKEELLSILK